MRPETSTVDSESQTDPDPMQKKLELQAQEIKHLKEMNSVL